MSVKISEKSIEKLTDIITGNGQASPRRSGPQLICFFNDFGERDLYGRDFPSRAHYVQEKLQKFNGTDMMKCIICSAFNFWGEQGFDPKNEARQFNQALAQDGYRLIVCYYPGFMQDNEYMKGEPYFELHPVGKGVITPHSLLSMSHAAISEHIAKTNYKVDTGDFSGAITSAYTLVEHLLKLLLKETNTPHKQNEGDIRALFNTLRGPLGLDPASDTIASPLKPILSGFQKLVGGLYEIANKASDRHARRYNPARHHAQLAANAAFSLSGFLFDSYEYQKARSAEIMGKQIIG